MPAAKHPMMACTENPSPAGSALRWASILLCSAALLGGCGGKGDKTQSQVAARVNDEEITIYQVNNQLARSGVTGEAAAKEASKKILDSLIDQTLLAQQAVRKKLDRDPMVLQAIEDTKRQILAQAYVERLVYSHSQPTAADAKEFYASHQDLFAKRKAYKFHAFAIAKETFNDSLKSALDGAKSTADVASILKSRAIDAKQNEMQWMSEQVPMEMLAAIAKMKMGDIVTLEQNGQMIIMVLEGMVDSPIDEERARATIEKFIANTKNKELLDNKLKQLRAGEQIEYVGPFAPEKPADATPPAPVTKEPQATTPQPQTEDFLQKGLKGLK